MPDFTNGKSGGQRGILSKSLGCSEIDMRLDVSFLKQIHQRAEFELGRDTGSVGDSKEEEFQNLSASYVQILGWLLNYVRCSFNT